MNPCIAVAWNEERRRQAPIAWAALPAGGEKIEALGAIRRDFLLVALTTGLRSADAASIRWTDLDFEAGTLFRPNPKGGEDRAFTIPLSAFTLDILARRRNENAGRDGGFEFPCRSNEGTVPAARRAPLGKARESPHRLRDTYTTACVEAGLHTLDIHVLTNHWPPRGTLRLGQPSRTLTISGRAQERGLRVHHRPGSRRPRSRSGPAR